MKDYHSRWTWRLQATAEDLWPLVADTDHFDQDTGMNRVSPVEKGEPLRNGRKRLRVKLSGFWLEFVQEPFEWISPYRFGVVRHFTRGPMKQLRILTELTPQDDGGTVLTYQVWARPRNVITAIGIPLMLQQVWKREFGRVFQQYDALAQRGQSFYTRPEARLMPQPMNVTFAPGGRERLKEVRRELARLTGQPELVERLVRLVAEADDLTVDKLRPYVLADTWGVPRRQVLELALYATRVGLLDFRWELLCPMCRSARATAHSLADTTKEVHCDTCHISYQANFERSVELTFRPNPAIRPIEEGVEFCYAGPVAAPHILVQQLLAPGEERTVRPRLDPGYYQIETFGLDGHTIWHATPGGDGDVTVLAEGETLVAQDQPVDLQPVIHLQNHTSAEQLFIIERSSWSNQAVTAAEVIVLQRFRDLFSQEALRPGEQIFVGTQTIVFTDLRGSTQMYRTIGDAPAFGIVMDHFTVLRQAIDEEGGSIVKTIGDAVMAVFRQPAAAFRAMLTAQKRLAQANPPLTLKVGIHTGPCIAVTLNERLDFFGSTVNMAARLQGLSVGDDLVCSQAVYQDPEVVSLVATQDQQLTAHSFETNLKGFADDCFTLWRCRQN